MNTVLPYEIHITVDVKDNLAEFTRLCEVLGSKPIVLELPNTPTREVMTKHVTHQDNVAEAVTLAASQMMLLNSAFSVSRVKIETVPHHPDAPSRANKKQLAKGAHFETHYKIHVMSSQDDVGATLFAATYGLHKSKNVIKQLPDGSWYQMVTDRSYSMNSDEFMERTRVVTEGLKSEFNLTLAKRPQVEFSIFDTAPMHDNDWLSSYWSQRG